MTRKAETAPMLRGRAPHRRTQTDYMGALLDRVPLETWGEVVDATVAKAKDGDAQARAFLAAYLVGKPAHDAPEPLAVTAARLAGNDPLVRKLAHPIVERIKYPSMGGYDETESAVQASIAHELPARIEPQP